uniref:DUF6532 domain-containing protein n=1 Tax=Mycena chlorophos TaxID=658473 RepID=A0ABQ0MB77_MYCCL|nr:predicted protein [Mycena chlorophos]
MPNTRPLTVYSDDDDDDSSGAEFISVPQPPAKKTPAPRKKPAGEAPAAPTKRKRTASEKQAANGGLPTSPLDPANTTPDKENMEKLLHDNEKLKKQLRKAQKANTEEGNDQDGENDGFESEEPMTDTERPIGASGRIRPLEPLPLPANKPRKLRKVGSGGPKQKQVKVSSLLNVPEPTAEEAALDSQTTPPSSPQRPSGPDTPLDDTMHVETDHPATSSPARAAADRRKKRPATSEPEAPPAKRHDDARLPEFREGYVSAGGKPKARDYAPADAAVIVRVCLSYAVALLREDAMPATDVQTAMVAKAWREGCRVGRVRMKMTERVSKIILARGSQVRGKIVEAFRTLVATDFGLERSTNRKVIASNKAIVESLTREGDVTFHFQVCIYLLSEQILIIFEDPSAEIGYGEHKSIAAVRKLTVFRDKKAYAARFPSAFNPIPIPLMALEFTALEHCLKEWQTGSHVPAKFAEKDVRSSYRTHLADITRWTELDAEKTLKLRQKWYKRASATLGSTASSSTPATNLSDARLDKLRAQLESRTGDTDSEPEGSDDDA